MCIIDIVASSLHITREVYFMGMFDKQSRVYDYETDMNLADKRFHADDDKYSGAVIKNVPMYNMNDFHKLCYLNKFEMYKKFGVTYTIRTWSNRGPENHYIPATTAIRKFVEQEQVFALLRGDIDKPLKLHKKKYVRPYERGGYKFGRKLVRFAEAYIVPPDQLYYHNPERL